MRRAASKQRKRHRNPAHGMTEIQAMALERQVIGGLAGVFLALAPDLQTRLAKLVIG